MTEKDNYDNQLNKSNKKRVLVDLVEEHIHQNKRRKFNKKDGSFKDFAERLNEIYLSLISSLEDKEEYEHFQNMYRNEEFDYMNYNKKPMNDHQMKKLQKLLNHTFGILPLDRFNEIDYEKLEDMNVDDSEEESSSEEESDEEDYDITPEDIIIDIQDEIVEKFSKKMEKNKDFLDFFLGVEGKSIKGKKGMSEEDAIEKHNYDEMCKQINKSELVDEEKEKLKKEYTKIQDYAKTLLPDDLKILNKISDNLKNALVAESNIFVMPSFIHKSSVEGFGIVYAEAAKYGIPSIGGKDGGASDAIEHEKTGLICDGNNLDEIYSSINLMLENKKYLEYGKNAQNYVTKFYWPNIIEEFKRILN